MLLFEKIYKTITSSAENSPQMHILPEAVFGHLEPDTIESGQLFSFWKAVLKQ